MRVTASRELRDQPKDIALLPTGELVIWSWSAQGILLHAYNEDLGVVWNRNVGPHARRFRVDSHGTLWVADHTGASAFNGKGEMIGRAEPPALPGMEVASLAFFEDDFVFAYQHEEGRAPDLPALVRLTRDGAVRWSSRLTTEAVGLDRPFDIRSSALPDSQFVPKSWVLCTRRTDGLKVSGDIMLAVYTDMPQTGIAIGYAVSLTDGTLRYVTRAGPIDCVEPFSSGSFLVGFQGYGAFATILYDGHGGEQQRWGSQGHYLITGNDIRVIELKNTGVSMSRLVRLMPDGTVVRGDLLEGYYTSRPHVQTDGTTYFARHGLMNVACDLLIEGRIQISRGLPRDEVFHSLAGGPQRLFATYSANRVLTPGPISHVSGLLRIAIGD